MPLALPRNERSSPPSAAVPVSSPPVLPARPGTEEQARSLAHDARNWLTVLQIYCDLLLTPGAVAGEYQGWLKELAAAVERGQSLVIALLHPQPEQEPFPQAASFPHAKRPAIEAPPTRPPLAISLSALSPSGVSSSTEISSPAGISSMDISSALQRRLPLFRRMAAPKVRVEMETLRGPAPVALSENEFERILLNLVRNALEAMPGGGTLRIALRRGSEGESLIDAGQDRKQLPPAAARAMRGPKSDTLACNRPPRETLLLRISDTGTGIAPELLPYIFDSGFSSKIPGKADSGSRGYGLAIARELTDRAGGILRVRSHSGDGAAAKECGTCMEVELPLLPPAIETACQTGSALPSRSDNSGAPQDSLDRLLQGPHSSISHLRSRRKGTRVKC